MSAEKAGYTLNVGSVEPTPIESPAGSNKQLFDGDSDGKAPPGTSKEAGGSKTRPSRWKVWTAIACAAVIVLVLAIVLPLYFTVIKKQHSSSGGSGGGSSGSSSGDLPVTQPVSILFC
jgi:glucan 1,3-beta-glucosidase